MSDTNTEVQTKDATIKKVEAQINEDKVFKDLSSLQLARFKTIDDLLLELHSSDKLEDVRNVLIESLTEDPGAPGCRYMAGMLDFSAKGQDENGYLRSLLKDCSKFARWPIVDHIADQMLVVDDENKIALRAKVESTERLKGKKELGPYLEKLASVDRKNPDIVKKYAHSILEEKPAEAIKLYKQAGETYARLKDYRNLDDVWNVLVDRDFDDLPYFEKLERIIVGNREKTRMAAYLVSLLEPHKTAENWPQVINLLKKILDYEPTSSRARSDLVRAYRVLYADHSLLDEFLKISELTNHKKAPGPCVAQFERNIVFDQGNYVYHRTRGVGKIKEISDEYMIVDFAENPDQRMSIQMAISSLQPLQPDHIWVKHYENPDEVNEIFAVDVPMFFELLISSFKNKMVLAEIKQEVVGTFLEQPEWSKWWSKARAQLKKDPKFGFNPRKKDELILRERPITLSEELMLKFQSVVEWDKKLDLAMETLKEAEAEGAFDSCVQFYKENESNKDPLKQLHSFLFLELAEQNQDEEIPERTLLRDLIVEIFKTADADKLIEWCAATTQVELKKEIVKLVIEIREDFTSILLQVLFEVPIKINKYVITELNRKKHFDVLEEFIEGALKRYREKPEIFVWVAKNTVGDVWNYEWIKHSKEELVLQMFRLLKPLQAFEMKGTRLKNAAIETIFGTTHITVDALKTNPTLVEIVEGADVSALRRMYALFREVPYAVDAHKENFFNYLKELRSDFSMDTLDDDDDDVTETPENLFPTNNEILVTASALQARKEHLDNLINIEMPANSRDIGEAQEKGDLRENAEYKAAMERQSQLRAEITRVNAEIKRARAIDPGSVRTDLVAIGSRVNVKDAGGKDLTYSILGPWDADTQKNIISYESPLGKVLIGSSTGDKVKLGKDQEFEVLKIASAF